MTTVFKLPPPTYPMVTLVISDNLAPVSGQPETTRWAVGSEHPHVPGAKVVRMFIGTDAGGGIEIFSYLDAVEGGDAVGMRDFVPMGRIRFVQEAMPLEVFADELEAAESDGTEPEEEEPQQTTGGQAQV